MKQGAELDATDSFWVLNKMYYPTDTDTSTALTCIDIFTAFQTAMISGATHRAKPVVLNPMSSEFPILGRFSYLGITTQATVIITLQIVRSSCESANLV
jgi:hypothetical protein